MKWEEAFQAIVKDQTKGARVVGWTNDYFCIGCTGLLSYCFGCSPDKRVQPKAGPNPIWYDVEWELVDRIDRDRPKDWNIYKDPDLSVDLWPKYPRKIMVRK
jgi:hypothetical protein